jgi:hypothetical protein
MRGIMAIGHPLILSPMCSCAWSLAAMFEYDLPAITTSLGAISTTYMLLAMVVKVSNLQ